MIRIITCLQCFRVPGRSAACIAALLLSGCGSDTESYFPLGQRLVLGYDIVEERSSNNHHSKNITQFTGPVMISIPGGQEPVYRWLTGAGPRGLIQVREDGIYLIADKDRNQLPVPRETETLLLPLPLTTGRRWQATTTTELLEWRKHTLEAADRNPAYTVSMDYECRRLDAVVRTPAGTFTNVAEITGTGERRVEIGGTRDLSTIRIEITEWYAPGVGLVQRERRETTDNQLLNPGTAKMVLERID